MFDLCYREPAKGFFHFLEAVQAGETWRRVLSTFFIFVRLRRLKGVKAASGRASTELVNQQCAYLLNRDFVSPSSVAPSRVNRKRVKKRSSLMIRPLYVAEQLRRKAGTV